MAHLRFDRPIPFGLYRDNRDLGGFILIDRITNETVAFGMIAPRAPEDEGESAPVETGIDWPRVRRDLAEKLVPAIAGGVVIGLGAKLFGASTATAVALGLADAAFRPLFRNWYGDFRAAMAKRRSDDEVTPDGAGI